MKTEAKMSFSAWIDEEVKKLPARINLLYLESQTNGQEVFCSLFGFKFPRRISFDPEDTDHLDKLSEWDWESNSWQTFTIEKIPSDGIIDGDDVKLFLRRRLFRSKALRSRIEQRGLSVIYGEHEASPEHLIKPKGKPLRQNDSSKNPSYYYELCFESSGSHFIEKYKLRRIDEQYLLNGERIPSLPDGYSIQVTLQPEARLKGLLYFYRGWLVCSRRLTRLLQKFTSHIQALPVTVLIPEGKTVKGYLVVNLYDKVDCIGSEWLEQDRDGIRLSFGKNYQLIASDVTDKDIVRASVYPYPIFVSPRLHDELERQRISGLSWLKRKLIKDSRPR